VAEGSVEFFDPKNNDELVQKMIEKMNNPETNRHQFILKNNISWSDTAERTYNIYSALYILHYHNAHKSPVLNSIPSDHLCRC